MTQVSFGNNAMPPIMANPMIHVDGRENDNNKPHLLPQRTTNTV